MHSTYAEVARVFLLLERVLSIAPVDFWQCIVAWRLQTNLVPFIMTEGIQVFEFCETCPSRVVDDDIKPTELLDGLPDQPRNGLRIPNVLTGEVSVVHLRGRDLSILAPAHAQLEE